jgi:hypothetical protein
MDHYRWTTWTLERAVRQAQKKCALRIVNSDIYAWQLEILEDHVCRAIVAAGESVGPNAAQSIAETATQLTFNTFHFAGAQSVLTTGVPRLKEVTETHLCSFFFVARMRSMHPIPNKQLIDLRKKISTQRMRVFLKPEFSDYASAEKVALSLPFVALSDVLSDRSVRVHTGADEAVQNLGQNDTDDAELLHHFAASFHDAKPGAFVMRFELVRARRLFFFGCCCCCSCLINTWYERIFEQDKAKCQQHQYTPMSIVKKLRDLLAREAELASQTQRGRASSSSVYLQADTHRWAYSTPFDNKWVRANIYVHAPFV